MTTTHIILVCEYCMLTGEVEPPEGITPWSKLDGANFDVEDLSLLDDEPPLESTYENCGACDYSGSGYFHEYRITPR